MKDGDDILIVACGMMVAESLRAANLLSEKGIHACVLNMHTIKPLDKESLLKYTTKCRAVVSVEEHSIYGGLGSAVAEALSLSKIPLKIVGINDVFGESGKPEELFAKFGLTAENIVKACDEVLSHKDKHTTEVKEIKEMIKDINHDSPPKKDNDPRGRIIRMSDHDKKKVDDVLYK